MGAFYPFFRGHAHLDTKRREPWLFGEPYTSHIRDAIRLRYIYLPYLYTLFHETSVNGAPIVRPLWVEYPQDEKSFTIESQLLVGKDLLLAPVLEQGARMKEVYFPPGSSWFEVSLLCTMRNVAWRKWARRWCSCVGRLGDVPDNLLACCVVDPKWPHVQPKEVRLLYNPTSGLGSNPSLPKGGLHHCHQGAPTTIHSGHDRRPLHPHHCPRQR